MANRYKKMLNIINYLGNANQNLTPVGLVIVKKLTNNKCWQGYGEKGTLYNIGGIVKRSSHYWDTEKVPQKS